MYTRRNLYTRSMEIERVSTKYFDALHRKFTMCSFSEVEGKLAIKFRQTDSFKSWLVQLKNNKIEERLDFN